MNGDSYVIISLMLAGIFLGFVFGSVAFRPDDYYAAIAHCSEQYDKEQVKNIKGNVRIDILANCPGSDTK